MTERQKRFCEYLLTEPTQGEAAIKAGYSPKWAAQNVDKLLKSPNVQKYQAELADKLEDNRIAKPREILQTLTGIVRRDEQFRDYVVVKKHMKEIVPGEDGKRHTKEWEDVELVEVPPALKDVIKAAEALIDRWEKYLGGGEDDTGTGAVILPAADLGGDADA